MVNLFEAVFLGTIQGFTEWLPISSSGHLVIIQQLLGMHVPLLFDVFLHVGTLLALFVFFWEDIWKILSALLRFDFKSENGRFGLFVLIGSVPIALTGFFLYETIAVLFNNLVAVGFALIITGSFLYATKIFKDSQKLNSKSALIVGVSQAASLIPGISRSGVTISSALFKRINRQQAFVFSFMLAIPAIIGASAFELYRAATLDLNVISFEMVIGAAVAAVFGYISLKFLQDSLKKRRLYCFAYYCWLIGTILLIYTYFGL